ncbi:AIPR family protein [Rhodococcus sp. 852002-51564_SCH6189132-a]|uniref:AIPR family protein n=1 Tax=Rhodococcus sp. 852002-51564_SCH6189132-a TaxID=1834103 RepID=UPI0009EE9000|nr:AIPR family protein [Rhodococcus sp. 852002-51564_SCH6189132-a]
MDRVTQSLLKSYVDAAGLENLSETQQFERFTTHIALSKLYGGTFSADDFCVGDGVQGFDAVALSVNGALISDISQLDDIMMDSGPISAEFVFVQAKTSSKFELGDLSIFADASESLIRSQDPSLHPEFSEMLDLLWEKSDMFSENPVIRLYYVSTGKWESPAPIEKKIAQTKQSLLDSNLVSRVEFSTWGAAEVQSNWRAIDRGLKKTILFESKTTLPEMPRIEESFLGILPASELLKLVTDEDGEIRKALFYDNVRDFQGDVDVNADIRKTLRSADRTRFCVLNNGVTVVAKSLKTTGNRFTLHEYQVVNGCQTSHVLHAERDNLEDVHIPFRLIVTADDAVARSITTATNQQTQVSKENLLALLDEQKAIEQYFNTYKSDEDRRIYYERRSKQWVGSQQVRGAWRVITLRNLLQSFASMYLKVPHTAARYYGDLRDRAKSEVFTASHHPAYFYSAAYAYCKLDHFFRNEQIDRKFKPARYHLLAGVRTAFTGTRHVDAIESKEAKAERALDSFNRFLWDDKRYLGALLSVAAVIDDAAGGEITREFGRNREQTEALLDAVTEKVRIPPNQRS